MSDRKNLPSLAEGLRELPVRDPGPDFNLRVLAGLEKRAWSWPSFLMAARPVVSTALVALVATLALLKWSSSAVNTTKWAGSLPASRSLPGGPFLVSGAWGGSPLRAFSTFGTIQKDQLETP